MGKEGNNSLIIVIAMKNRKMAVKMATNFFSKYY